VRGVGGVGGRGGQTSARVPGWMGWRRSAANKASGGACDTWPSCFSNSSTVGRIPVQINRYTKGCGCDSSPTVGELALGVLSWTLCTSPIFSSKASERSQAGPSQLQLLHPHLLATLLKLVPPLRTATAQLWPSPLLITLPAVSPSVALLNSRLAAILRPSSSALPRARPHFCPQAFHNPTGRTHPRPLALSHHFANLWPRPMFLLLP
jgi:hypothetical protein